MQESIGRDVIAAIFAHFGMFERGHVGGPLLQEIF